MDAKTTWGDGEYSLMAQALEPASLLAVDAAHVGAGDRVLDVATGTGNAALLAAARGAEVLAVDLEPALLHLGELRARDLGVQLAWVEGDMQALPVQDRWADVALSVFGAMYARDHAAAARELVRAVRPGGRLAIAAWMPGSAMAAMGSVLARYLPPPPPASGPPTDWGRPDKVGALLENAGAPLDRAEFYEIALSFDNPADAADFLIRTGGHVVAHRAQLTAAGRWRSLCDDLAAFARARGERRDGRLQLRLEYLLLTAGRR